MSGIPVLTLSRAAAVFANTLLRNRTLPPNARIDALHVAIAVVHGMDYLLTWNCRHIANAPIRGKIEAVCREAGMQPPIICTPEELLEA